MILKESIDFRSVFFGFMGLFLGSLVYVFFRSPGTAYFVPEAFNLFGFFPPMFGKATNSLPVFSHVLALSLITGGLLSVRNYGAVFVCSSWLLIELLFEIGQHPRISPWVIETIPDWFSELWLLDATRSYFADGTFDPIDLLAIVIGALTAYLIFLKNDQRSLA